MAVFYLCIQNDHSWSLAEQYTRNRRVFRRQKRLCRSVIQAIDDSIDALWAASGIGTDGTARLKRRGRARDGDVIIIVGQPTFGSVRGHRSAPAKAFVEQVRSVLSLFFFVFHTILLIGVWISLNWKMPFVLWKQFVSFKLCKRFRCLIINEYKTSKLCDICGAYLVKTRAWSIRQWRCPNDSGNFRRCFFRCIFPRKSNSKSIAQTVKVIVVAMREIVAIRSDDTITSRTK